MDFLEINCHILHKKGALETISFSLTAPYTAHELLKNLALAGLISCDHRIFLHPTHVANAETCLKGLSEVFILSKARISPQEWRQNRLQVARALLNKVP